VFVSSTFQPTREPRAERRSDDGPRVFDRKLCVWLAVGQPCDRWGRLVEVAPRPPERLSAIPMRDGSGCWWRAAGRDGQLLWRIEAWSFEAALEEKRRLCAIVGCRSGEVWLKQEI